MNQDQEFTHFLVSELLAEGRFFSFFVEVGVLNLKLRVPMLENEQSVKEMKIPFKGDL